MLFRSKTSSLPVLLIELKWDKTDKGAIGQYALFVKSAKPLIGIPTHPGVNRVGIFFALIGLFPRLFRCRIRF